MKECKECEETANHYRKYNSGHEVYEYLKDSCDNPDCVYHPKLTLEERQRHNDALLWEIVK